MGNMDGWAHPNVAVQPGSECVQRCGCSAECCQRLMGGGGHIVSAPTKQEASRASVHGVDWVEARHRAQHKHSNSVQNTLGDWCGDVRVWVAGMVGGLVVAGASWGFGKNVVNLTKSSQCPC